MLAHGWTYQALVSDCLEIKLNQVRVPAQQQQSKKLYDLDAKDFFWARNAAHPFPQVAEEIDVELNKYKQDAAEITRSTGISDVNDISQLYVSTDTIYIIYSFILRQGSVNERKPSENSYHATARAHSKESDT